MAGTAPATAWEKSYGSDGSGGTYKDTGASVWQTDDDGFIITGQTSSKGQSTTTRVMLVKTDWQGNVMWTKYCDDGEEGRFVRQTSDGGYIVVGQKGGNPFVLKTDKNGDKVWDKVYPRPNGKTGVYNCIWPASDGGYVMTGQVYGNDQKVQWDMYAARIDSTGNIVWEKSYADVAGPGEYCFASWPTGDGGFILGGSLSPLRNPDTGSVTYPAALVKIDANGNRQWFKILKELEGRYDSEYGQVQQTRDGGYIWASVKSGKMHLIKADANGNHQWDTTFDVYGVCYSVQQTWDDGYLVTGGPTNAADVIVIRTDPAGKLLWQKNLKGEGLGKGISVQQIGNGSYVVAGFTLAATKNAQPDFYLAELDKDMTPVPNAKLISDSIPHVMEAGKAYSVQATFENTGTMPWTFQDETTFGHHGDAAKFGVTGANQTIQIGKVVRPGQSETFSFTMTAPAENGTYNPRFRMMREGHDPFGTLDNKTIWVVNGTGPAVSPPAIAPASAVEIGAAPQATAPGATQAAPTTAPATATPAQGSGGIPCLSSVLLPLLAIGVVFISLYQHKKGDN